MIWIKKHWSLKVLHSSFQSGSFHNSKDPISLPNYGLLDLPPEDDQTFLPNDINTDAEDDSQFSIEAIEAENPLIEDFERSCPKDQSDYCKGASPNENIYKTKNHTMCKYCVRSMTIILLSI